MKKLKALPETELQKKEKAIEEVIKAISKISKDYVVAVIVTDGKDDTTIMAGSKANAYTALGLAEMLLENIKQKIRDKIRSSGALEMFTKLLDIGKKLSEVKNNGGAKEGKVAG